MTIRAILFLFTCITASLAADRPNIVWITSEDNDYGWLGCYGNKEAQTPCLDRLAKNGLLFKHAYSNAPVCAVARSTIINGVYAPTQGTQHMRSRHPIPSAIKPYVFYLKAQGYYCTNRSKTDYNFKGDDTKMWDECSKKAHYKNRPKGSPFFAIFNITTSHESSLFGKKKKKQTTRLKPSEVNVRPYLPDLPEIRSDIAHYHDIMSHLDGQVRQLIDDLEAAGVADNTIIFYYSDHGGITPRGKRYLKDTGVRIPMIVHLPKKWQHFSPFKPGEHIDETVTFVDLAPTLLSLIGMEKPEYMQGRAFLGSKRTEPGKDDVEFLFADRFDELYGMRRGITNGRWKYIRRFTPHLPAAPYSYYQFGQLGWHAWREAWEKGELSGRHKTTWEANQAVEELFDTHADPWEVNNLAADPAYAKQLQKMRQQLADTMIAARDTAIVPEPMFKDLAPHIPLAEYITSRHKDLSELIQLAFKASSRDSENLSLFISLLDSSDPVRRYWAAQGCLVLGKAAAPAREAITKTLQDKYSAIRVAAAHSLINIGEAEIGKTTLLAELMGKNSEFSKLNAANTLTQLSLLDIIPDTWLRKAQKDKSVGWSVQRIARKIEQQRKQ